jgi:hypothetical protein
MWAKLGQHIPNRYEYRVQIRIQMRIISGLARSTPIIRAIFVMPLMKRRDAHGSDADSEADDAARIGVCGQVALDTGMREGSTSKHSTPAWVSLQPWIVSFPPLTLHHLLDILGFGKSSGFCYEQNPPK